MLACLLEAIGTYDKPKIIRTDNEACPEPVEVAIFTSKQFRLGLKKLGIRHQRTDQGCPWQNGRIERLFGTLKQKLDQLTYSPLPQAGEGLGVITSNLPACGLSRMASSYIREQLNRDLNTFRYWYNHVRPHQNLNGRTPAEAWRGDSPYWIKEHGYQFSEDRLTNGMTTRYSKQNGQILQENNVMPRSQYRVSSTFGNTKDIYLRSQFVVDTLGEVLATDTQIAFNGGWAERFLAQFSDAGGGTVAWCTNTELDPVIRHRRMVSNTLNSLLKLS